MVWGVGAGCTTSSGGDGRSDPGVDAYRFRLDGGPDGVVWDASVPPDAALPPSPEACAAACAPIADCAAADAPDGLCDGVSSQDRDGFLEACVQICTQAPGFDSLFGSLGAGPSCATVLELMRQTVPDLAYACVPNPPPPNPVCEAFGPRVAACVGEICANAAPVAPGLGFWLTRSCNQSVAAGQIGEADLAGFPGADTPCDEPVLANFVDGLVGSATDQRTLTSLCTFGPATAAETCGLACAHLAPCLAPNHVFRNPDYCAFVCALDGSLSATMTCAARTPACEPLGSCF